MSTPTIVADIKVKKPRVQKKDQVPTYQDVLEVQKKRREKQIRKLKAEFLEWFTKNIVNSTPVENIAGFPPRVKIIPLFLCSLESTNVLSGDRTLNVFECLSSTLPKTWKLVRVMGDRYELNLPIVIIAEAVDIMTKNTNIKPNEKKKKNDVVTTGTTTTTTTTTKPSKKRKLDTVQTESKTNIYLDYSSQPPPLETIPDDAD